MNLKVILGVFFEMITTEMHRRPPQTTNEMIDLNYTIYVAPASMSATENEPSSFVMDWLRNYEK